MTKLLIPAPQTPQTLGSIDEDLTLLELISTAAFTGAERGYNETADILTQTADGTSVNQLWREFQQAITLLNRDRTAWINRLTFRVTNPIEGVTLPGGTEDFEEASEFGEPKGIRPGVTQQFMGYPFKWYDLAMRFTWQYLAENTGAQVEALNAMALEASNRLMFNNIFRTVFNPANGETDINEQPYTVYKFYNADGTVPPSYKTTTHAGSHTHYLSSGAVTVDSGDLNDIEEHLHHHGYRMVLGYQLVLFVNKAQGDVIRTFRVANEDKYDFIPTINVGGGTYLEADERTIIGRPSLGGFPNAIGTYGPFVVVEDEYIPVGYLLGLASGGDQNIGNPVGLREHANASLRGLRLVKGRDNDYPLVDSFYIQGLGSGVRHRGAGVVMRIGTAAYSAPAQYA